jgi:preprotein translocase subunit SecY
MAIGGSISLIILAGVAAGLAIALFELREWAWSASIISIGLGTVCTVLGLFAFRRFFLMPIALSLLCHLLVLAIAVYMLSYLLKPTVRQAFTTSNA